MLGLVRKWIVFGVVSAAAVGCQIEDPAQGDIDRLVVALCEQAEACACAGTPDETTCDTRKATWDSRLAYARSNGLVFDPECSKHLEVRIPRSNCDSSRSIDLCLGHCTVFHGNVQPGEACTALDATTSDCAQGLSCVDGVCQTACAGLGGLAAGERCMSEGVHIEDCAEGLACDPNSEQCVPPPSAGEACLFGDCGQDAWCDFDTDRCVALPSVGEPCGDTNCASDATCEWEIGICEPRPGENEDCRSKPCAEGLVCHNDDFVCRTPARFGQPCGTVPCVNGLTCQDGTCGGYGELNARCEHNDHCTEGLWCDDGSCRARLDEGGDCTDAPCLDGLWCDNNVCEAPRDVGDQCEGSYECQQGLWCDWNLGQCAPLPNGEGQPCAAGECGEGLWCDNGVDECRPLSPYGEPCMGHRECESGFCPAGFCITLPALGEPCAINTGCGRGLNCDGDVCVVAVASGPAACSFPGW
jgi:hypothetical protein